MIIPIENLLSSVVNSRVRIAPLELLDSLPPLTARPHGSLGFQLPEKTEPALADKEIIMAALNIKSMNFGSNFLVGNIDEDKGFFNDNRFEISYKFLEYCQECSSQDSHTAGPGLRL